MSKLTRTRNGQLIILVITLMSILGLRLFGLTIVEGAEWSAAAEGLSVKNISLAAPRGEILDRYGRVLATNTPSFTVYFSAGDLENKEINKVATDLVQVLEKNGDAYFDNFPIMMDSNGEFYYTYQRDIEEWLTSEGMPKDIFAEQAFNELLTRNNIDPAMDKYEAQAILQNTYGVYPPISVKNMKYSKELDKESFLGRYYLEFKMSAREAFDALRKEFEIPGNVSDADARKIMVIRNELSSQGYRKYMPAKIASGISQNSVIIFEEKKNSLPGVEIITESVRTYPNGSLASHAVGYLGKISESEKDYYKELGYNTNDMVGQEGLEKAFESKLKGSDGEKNVQVNAFGELVKVIDDKAPAKGKDITTTLDLELQKTVEESLEETLVELQRGGTYQSKWGNYNFNKAMPRANTGAVVVLDVKTSEVLAIASYPDFDPNLFAKGISNENWDALQSKNPRDTMSPRPLYNVATRTPVQPGSTFKMVTATAAMESGMDPNRKLYDGGAVTLGKHSYGCLIWNQNRGSHGYVDLADALEVSCNYYFFDVAANKDFYKNTSLGLKNMNVEKIGYYAKQYGLGLPTGIEISETVVPEPSAARKMEQMKSLLKNVLIGRAELYFTETVVDDKTKLMENIDTIVSWTEENPGRRELISRMAGVGIKPELAEDVADLCKFTYYNQASWNTGDDLNLSIGQGGNQYTPLQMANYVATIGNKGVHNDVTLLRSIEGEGAIERPAGKPMDLSDPAYLDELIKGMKQVVYGPRGSMKLLGTAPVTVAAKTGTAERDGKVPPLDEVAYIKSNLSKINPRLSWSAVEKEMRRLLEVYSDVFSSEQSAVRQAVINLSKGSVTPEKLDAYKAGYDEFAWVVALAPAENPEIAIAALLVQGGTSTYEGPMVRDIIARYTELQEEYKNGVVSNSRNASTTGGINNSTAGSIEESTTSGINEKDTE